MNALKLFWLLFVFASPLFAQTVQVDTDQKISHGVCPITAYCDSVDEYAEKREPHLFAELRGDSTEESESLRWKEFPSKAEWEAAGNPTPLAFVWDRGGAIVRVAIVYPPPVWISYLTNRRTEYCYGTGGQLSRIRAVWFVPTQCEVLFPCLLLRARPFFIGQTPEITDWVFTEDGRIREVRDGKLQNDHLDSAHSLRLSDLHLSSSDDLPFGHE